MRNAQVREYMDKKKLEARKSFKKLLSEYQQGKSDSSNFCAAPFVHMYVHSNEGQRVCCMSTENSLVTDNLDLDLKKRWSNEYYKEFRKKFLRNERPDVCVKCYELEEHGGRSDRINFNSMYISDIVPNVETGNQHNSPLDLDIRPGNLCNLKCRMCGPISSSQFEKELLENTEILRPFLGKGQIRKSDVLTKDYNIEFLLESANKGERIKFLGGEPTIMPEVDKFLDILIEKKYFDVPLHFTTNCTNNNKRFINKLSKFSRVSFNYSIDGIGKTLEYIRAPVKFDTINTTVPMYHALSQRERSEISFTLQAYNIFNLGDTVKWAAGHGVMVRPEILRFPEWDSIRSIPYEIRNKEFKRVLDDLSNLKYKNNLERIIPAVEQAMADKEEYNPVHLARATKRFDIVRNQHIKDYIPEVYEIIKKDYNDLQI